MTTITKGPNTTAEEFEWNLLLCDQLTDWSPGTTPVLTADELKQKPSSMECHIRGLPSSENQAKINISRQVMLAHMHDCQKESNAKQMKNMLKQQKKRILPMEDEVKDEATIAVNSALEAAYKTSNLVARQALLL